MSKQGFKRFGWHIVLALSMLLMQQGGLRHALQHTAADKDAAPAHATLCKDCLSYCAADAVAPQALALALINNLVEQRVATGYAQLSPAVITGYNSRAPPATSFWL